MEQPDKGNKAPSTRGAKGSSSRPNKHIGESVARAIKELRDNVPTVDKPFEIPDIEDIDWPATASANDDQNENLYDGYEMKEIKTRKGYSNQFAYRPENFVEYTIAQKALADMAGEANHFLCDVPGTLEVGLAQSQQVIRSGLCVFLDEPTKELVTIRAATDPDTAIYIILFHSYNVQALRRILKKYKKLCALSNFYKGKHLKIQHPNMKPPIKFLPDPQPGRIFGFEKIQASIVLNTISFFKCKEAHAIAPQRGILMYGNPGSGKSSIVCKSKAECLAEGITVCDFDCDAMQQSAYWYSIIEQWFAPALVVLEDFDLVAGDRSVRTSSTTTDLLSSLNGNMKKRLPIVTIATTNRLDQLDSAVIRARRMDKIFEVSGLAPEFQMELFIQKKLGVGEGSLQRAIDKIGNKGTGADVEEISASTVIYKSTGMKAEEAFDQALVEWEEGHAAKQGKMGFGN